MNWGSMSGDYRIELICVFKLNKFEDVMDRSSLVCIFIDLENSLV